MDEPTFTLAVKLSLVVSGWANAKNKLTRQSIAELVTSRLKLGDIQDLIDEVQVIEVIDGKDRLVVPVDALGSWNNG
jgi:hypothetical protein